MGLFGLDWDQLYAGVEESVKNASQDLVAVGVPALKSAVEQKAQAWLAEQSKQTDAELKTATATLLAKDSDPNSIGSLMTSATTQAAIAHYGPLILLGVGGILVFGMFLRK